MSPSRPVAAILPANQEHLAYNALRLSLGRENTAEEIPQIAAAVAEVAAKLSEISERVATTS
jgi:cysteine sulfinate desulfinase/cysteine desulfurase-like protein